MHLRLQASPPFLAVTTMLFVAALACASPGPWGRGSEATRLHVHADEAWTDTGVEVRVGDQIVVEYVTGAWSPWTGESYDALGSGGDPRCDCNVLLGASHAAMLARIGTGAPFLVGQRYEGGAGESGRLYLGINDTHLEDNSGSIRMRVEVMR